MLPDLERRFIEAEDRREITEKLYLYCRACDRLDEELMTTVFWPDAIATHGAYHGPAEGFWRGALNFLSRIEACLHYAINPIVEIDGNVGYQEALFMAWHRVAKGDLPASTRFLPAEMVAAMQANPDDVFDGFPGHDATKDEDAVFYGRYVNQFEKRGDEWRIIKHVCFPEWAFWREASERAAPVDMLGMSRRDRFDPTYWRRGSWPLDEGPPEIVLKTLALEPA